MHDACLPPQGWPFPTAQLQVRVPLGRISEQLDFASKIHKALVNSYLTCPNVITTFLA